MRKVFKSKKAVVIAGICILLAALILMNVAFSMFMSLSVFKKAGTASRNICMVNSLKLILNGFQKMVKNFRLIIRTGKSSQP